MIKRLARSIAEKTGLLTRVVQPRMQGHAPVVEQALSEPQQPLPESPVPGLIKQLRDPVAEVARDAALALGALGAAEARDALCAVVVNKENYFHCVVRSAAAESLGRLRDRLAVEALLIAVRDPVAETSHQAIRALGELGDERAVAALIAVAENADGYFLPAPRQTAWEMLGRFIAPAAVDYLRKHRG